MAMIELNFLGQVVRLNVPVEQHETLREAARILDQRVVEMKDRMQTVQVERALNIVALNLSFELLQEKAKNHETEQVLQNQIQQLSSSLETIFSRSTNQQTAYEIQ
ncbi:cell division protein ZapA [Pasteurella langaaensis DSM 22999]|uniref:Cell division protein ZapA n=1 Tax=Alitibacter langaaensis DSM 22999 TaxID=1122935 RepID=A0A2U0TGT9_9PAST|nr:cell division protein ZapA [Pasteurella langaaensis]PVX42839.1 cell division protein ZapA [Pasteurella langaaensis DSM 22999]